MAAWESSNEMAFLQIAQLDPRVTQVLEQPVKLRITIDGRRSNRWPDFAILYHGRPEIHEVKPDEAWRDLSFRDETRAIATYVETRGWRFSLTFESDLKALPRFANVQALWRQCARRVDPVLAIDMVDVAGEQKISIEDLIDTVGGQSTDDQPNLPEVRYAEVLALIAQGRLYHDRDVPLSGRSLVWTGASGSYPDRLLPFWSPLGDER
jgi:hypothetical protein